MQHYIHSYFFHTNILTKKPKTMEANYKVFWDVDKYSVYDANQEGIQDVQFSGSLADCEAWIRLKETGKI